MDTFSHAAWGGVVSQGRGRALAWAGALAGAAPDLLFFIPSKVEQVVERGWAGLRVGTEPGIWRADGPPLPPDLVEAYWRYYVHTHSFVWLAVATAAVLLFAPRHRHWAWLCVPYGLHILMDIPTHERYETRPLWPLSDWHVRGLTWGDPRILVPNYLALLAAVAWLRHRGNASRLARLSQAGEPWDAGS
jgi:hypothetical protein